MAHNNNHARSKQKRAKLRLLNFWNRVFAKRAAKSIVKIPGRTIIGDAIDRARKLDPSLYRINNRGDKGLNQRQKRKIKRQQPHGK